MVITRALDAVRRQQETDRRALGECRESFPGHQEAAGQAQEVLTSAAAQLEAKKAEQQQALPIIRKARELDLKIAEKAAPIKACEGALAEVSATLAALADKQKNDVADLENTAGVRADLLQQINGNQS